MLFVRIFFVLHLCVTALYALSGPAIAGEMGRAPVSTGTYTTLEGGYLHQDGDSVIGHGINPTGGLAPTTDTFVEPDEGWFAGLSVGYASPSALISGLPFTRAEVYFAFGDADDARTDTVGAPAATSLKSADGSAFAVVGDEAGTSVRRQSYEGGLRLATDQALGASSSLTWVVMPFARFSDEDTQTVASGTADTAWRSAGVETWSYGIAFALEPEVWVSPSVALVGRIGAGVYGYHADGDFSSTSTAPMIFDADISDEKSGAGFRGLLGVGVKVKLAPATMLTGFAEADYLSDVASAGLPDNQFVSATTSSLSIDDAWELRVGARLSIGLGP